MGLLLQWIAADHRHELWLTTRQTEATGRREAMPDRWTDWGKFELIPGSESAGRRKEVHLRYSLRWFDWIGGGPWVQIQIAEVEARLLHRTHWWAKREGAGSHQEESWTLQTSRRNEASLPTAALWSRHRIIPGRSVLQSLWLWECPWGLSLRDWAFSLELGPVLQEYNEWSQVWEVF